MHVVQASCLLCSLPATEQAIFMKAVHCIVLVLACILPQPVLKSRLQHYLTHPLTSRDNEDIVNPLFIKGVACCERHVLIQI